MADKEVNMESALQVNDEGRSAESKQCSSIQDSVCITDSSGQKLVPGDAVWIGHLFYYYAIYVGHQQVVVCRAGSSCLVMERELNLNKPFGRCTVISGLCPLFTPEERVERATSRVGTEFTEGDSACDGSDFPWWVFTGVGWSQANSSGFRLEKD